MFQIGFVCPVYNAQKFHDYTEAALLSFFATTPNGVAIVVDDGSNSWSVDYAARLNALHLKWELGEEQSLRLQIS